MTLGFSPNSNSGLIPTQLVYAGIYLLFIHLQEVSVFTMLFVLIAAAALFSGAPWLFSFALTALLVTIFPVLIVLLVIGAVTAGVIHHYRK